MLAHAITERLDEIALPRAPYSSDLMPVQYVEDLLGHRADDDAS